MSKKHINLTAEDKRFIKELLSKGELKIRIQKRALGLQLLDKGMNFKDVERHLGVGCITVSKWAKKYKAGGLTFLQDKPRSGRPAYLSGEDRAKVTALACSKPPKGYSRWSFRLLSDRLVELDLVEKISHSEVGRILKKTNFNRIEKNNGVFGR